MKPLRYILLLMSWLVLATACESERSNVPDYPVSVDIDLLVYPHFIPENGFQVFDEVFTKPTKPYEYVGYAGVLVWINATNEYCAADLCCPKCLRKDVPVKADGGLFAVCPLCGEKYDLSTRAFPTRGIADQPLKKYSVSVNRNKVQIRN
ncbi:MAG: hypothetical protein MJZ65_00270 [Paludibacteraceae bacterium]|nr:hypothetical protein [Paludibacteraceae bacterium]